LIEFAEAVPSYVAMLRGINVGGVKIIKMEKLRATFESLGFGDVKTYIQSGNVVFKFAKTSTASLEKKIAGRILQEYGFTVPVVVRTREELAAILKANPLLKQAGIDEARLHVTFLSGPAPKTAAETLKPLAARSERFAASGREIYLFCPEGSGISALSNTAIEKKLSLQATTRNWRTVNALFEMAR
jgi:uncharacterized protein (DUF1697 family)